MGWKDWPYWLKGGIILGSVFSLLSLFLWAIPYNFINALLGNKLELFFGIPALLSMITGLGHIDIGSGKMDIIAGITFSLLSFIIYFIPGSLIGWIYGKIKSKSQK